MVFISVGVEKFWWALWAGKGLLGWARLVYLIVPGGCHSSVPTRRIRLFEWHSGQEIYLTHRQRFSVVQSE